MDKITDFSLIYFLKNLYETQNYSEKILTNYIILIIMSILIYWFIQQIKSNKVSSNIWIIIYCVFQDDTKTILTTLLLQAFVIHFVINILITIYQKRRKKIALNINNVSNSDGSRVLCTKKIRKRN